MTNTSSKTILDNYAKQQAEDKKLDAKVKLLSKNFKINTWILRDKKSLFNIIKYGTVYGGNFDGIFNLTYIYNEDEPDPTEHMGVAIQVLRKITPGLLHTYITENWEKIANALSIIDPRPDLFKATDTELRAIELKEIDKFDNATIAKKLKANGDKGGGVRNYTRKAAANDLSETRSKINSLFYPRYQRKKTKPIK